MVTKNVIKKNIVDAFTALGGKPNKQGTISKEKLVSVLLKDFELTLDIDVTCNGYIYFMLEIYGNSWGRYKRARL